MSQVINMLWVGGHLSTLERMAITSHVHVGHAVRLWCYEDVGGVPAGVAVQDAGQILPRDEVFVYRVGEGAGSVSAFSNLFRYKLLAETDGWWCDTDVVALRPFEFPGPYVVASERTRAGAAVPTTCVMKLPRAVAAACYGAALGFDRATLRWGVIGPGLLGQVVGSGSPVDIRGHVQPPDAFCPVDWFDAERTPAVLSRPDLSRSYAVHLWHEMWRRQGIDKDGTFPKWSLYERLKNAVLCAGPTDRHILLPEPPQIPFA
jgi:hypothetical protein